MATNGWDQYINHLMGFFSKKKEEFTKQNVCDSCAIYGLDGTLWAASPKWKPLTEYDFTLEGLGDESSNIRVNEFKICDEISKGNRNASPAGARLCGTKFMMTTHEDGLTQLSKVGGGGSVMRTNKALIIGIWDKEAIMTNKLNQNAGDVALGVERVAKFMKVAGF